MDLVSQIADPLSAALKPHIERVNIAANQLSDLHPPIHNQLERIFEGIAGAVVVCHYLSKTSGWWNNKDGTPIDPTDPMVFGAKLALVHSEVSEALEGGRKQIPDSHLPFRRAEEVELADALIRIFDLAAARQLDLAGALIEKLAYNQQRADHKPEARFAEGGKSI